MSQRAETIEAWRTVAAGWEARRELIASATQPVAERLVELLDPQPGETILEVGAGFGDTGFLAAPKLRPGGRLFSTDAAPEMVEAAKRRAEELDLDEVSFAVEDAASLSLADASVDGVLCRWALMLVPEMDAAAAELTRVLRSGGRAAVAVWADPDRNEWMTAVGRTGLELGLMERPDPDAPGPFRLSGEGRLAGVLEAAGLAVETIEDVSMTWRADSADDWWSIVGDMSPTLRALLPRLTPNDVASLRGGAERRLARHLAEDGSLAVPSLARVALARRS